MNTCLRFMLLFLICGIAACRQSKHYSNIVYPAGGYAYPLQVEEKSKDFSFYPLRDSISVRDSFGAVWLGRLWLPAYNEKNISLAPMGEDILRFVASNAFGGDIIIVIKQGEIIVKENKLEEDTYSDPWPKEDTLKLNSVERFHLKTLRRWFPIPEKRNSEMNPWRRHYLDSLTTVYPELLSTAYYFKLIEKTLVPKKEKFDYTEKHIPITKKQFNDWVALLNESGYWQLPFAKECNSPAMADGVGYTMEASTKEKYNCVQWNSCQGGASNFYKACDSLAKLAHMEKHVHVAWAK